MKRFQTVQRCFRAFLLLLCCGFITGPQITLQLGAWSWMLASYSQENGLEQAIIETFGGERPCELCKIIEQSDAQSSEDRSKLPTQEKQEIKLMLGLAKALQLESSPLSHAVVSPYTKSALEAHHWRITPPPRNWV